jgi:tetratricopeptide (TPR) repeat protein
MTRFTRFHLLLILALLVGASAPSQTAGGVDILLAKARSLELRGRIDLAVQNWRKVLLVDPNQTEALAGLARSAKQNGQTDEERSYLDRLRRINASDPQIAAVERLLVFTPEERNRLDEAGRLAIQHKPDEAMKIYREVLGDQPPPPGRWIEPFYETEAASSGGREKAISELRQLCATNPNQEEYRAWLATVLTYDPKTRMEGLRLFESIKDPGTAEQTRVQWRQALLWEKENPDALVPIEAYLQHYSDPELQSIAAAFRAKQQEDMASADNERGFKALRSKDVESAEASFTKVLRQSPNDVNAITGLGYARLDQMRFTEALSLFDHAHALAPERQDVRDGYEAAKFWLAIERGAAAQQQNQYDAAIVAYKEALTLRPKDIGALLGMGNALVGERRFAEAAPRFQQVLNQAPNNIDAMAGLGFVWLREGKFDDAEKLFADARKLDPARKDVDEGYHNAKFWGLMSQAVEALNRDRPKDAIAAYQLALLLNPDDREALLGLANASEHAGDYPAAVKIYGRLTAANPNDEPSWLALIQAQVGEKNPQAAISTSQQIPAPVKQRMEAHSDYLAEMALVYYEAKQFNEGDQLLRRALEAARSSDSEDALSLRLHIAGTFMDRNETGRAIEIYKHATVTHPDNPSGWEGLIGAYTRTGDFSQAITAVRAMPQRSYDLAVKDAGFLDSVAVLYSTQGRCEEAENFLNRSLALDQLAGRPPAEGTRLQLADIWMRERNFGNAQDLYRDIVKKNVNSAGAWRGFLVALHQQRADETLVAEIPRIPTAIRTQLETDPSFLILEASAYSITGRPEGALPLLKAARFRYTTQSKDPPADLDIQLAWTMLAVSIDEPGLGDLLFNDKRRSDLTSKQRDAIRELYSTLSVRRAERAFETNPQDAFSILANAGHEYPGDRNIHYTLASLYLKRYEKQEALEVFQTWGMGGAQAGDYRVAVGTALSAHKADLADHFLRQGLYSFPDDPELMHMKARQDIARGDYDAGDRELRSALLAMRDQGSSEPQTKARPLPYVREDAVGGDFLTVHDSFGQVATSLRPAPPCRPPAPRTTASIGRIKPVNLVFTVRREESSEGQETSGQNSVVQGEARKDDQEQQIQDEVDVVEDRNTPLISTGITGTGRVGNPGFDRLIIADTLLGAAYTASDRLRIGVESHAVYANAGTPDGSSNLMFGTLPAKTAFGEQSSMGFSGIAQLSTSTFGLAVGSSPHGFAVHNLIGGIRFRPHNGWLTLLGVRDSLKDSFLSYAGAHDPVTGIRWGGVVSNTVTSKFDSAPSSNLFYKTIGEYASVSYSFIQGLHVPNNWSSAGNAGLYWQAVQGLTVGVNATAMHYDKNLNFFSFGQGGYFSPQQYYLASVPISLYSHKQRLEYQIRFSGGMQYLQQDASPVYPVSHHPAFDSPTVYPSTSSTTPNYDADIRMGYRMSPHMYLDLFATANNARDYYSQSVGFNLKFMLNRIPTGTDLLVSSIPDWTGKQPFAIR